VKIPKTGGSLILKYKKNQQLFNPKKKKPGQHWYTCHIYNHITEYLATNPVARNTSIGATSARLLNNYILLNLFFWKFIFSIFQNILKDFSIFLHKKEIYFEKNIV
jgi:hypothetical protein